MRGLLLIVGLLAAALLAWSATVEPRPVPVSAPADQFSSGRAMADVRVIAAAPHPVGSAANIRVRDHLLARMTQLGLSPRVQRDTGVFIESAGSRVSGGDVENLIGVLPGRDRQAPALVLLAHYDSAPRSPGAGDDAAGVAVTLETVRAIRVRGVPARDIMVVLTDGEEAAMLGAEAFFARDPAARRIGAIINLEARGGAGRALMFETGARNGALIGAFSRSAVAPTANSLANTVYSLMPNDTDFSIAKRFGHTGYNFGFLDAQFDYHSPTATAENLHEGSVQSMGAQVLSLAAQLAYAPRLPQPSRDVVFSQTFGSMMLAYPPWAGWIVLGAAAGLLALAVARARRSGSIVWRDAMLGLATGVLVIGLSAALLWVARNLTGVPFGLPGQLPLLARFSLWETALAVIVAAVLSSAAAFAARRDLASMWLGMMGPAALAAVALQIASPTAAYMAAWPLLIAAAGAGLSALGRNVRLASMVLLTALAAVGLGWLAANAHTVALALDAPAVLAIFAGLAAPLIWPLLIAATPTGGHAWIAPSVLLLVAVAIVAFIRFAPSFSARHPQTTPAFYVADKDGDRFWLATPLTPNDAWSKTLFAGAWPQSRPLPPLMRRASVIPAKPVALPPYAPVLAQAADCKVSVDAPWLPGARVLTVDVKLPGAADAVTLGGRSADLFKEAGQPVRFTWRNAKSGLQLALRPTAAGTAEVRYAISLAGWPTDAAPPPLRKASQMIWGDSDVLVLLGVQRLNLAAC